MGGLTSIVGAALPFVQVGQEIAARNQSKQNEKLANKVAMQQLTNAQALQEASSAQDAALGKQQLDLANAGTRAAAQQALREKQAAVRARLGAMGILSTGGSGDVVTRNLLESAISENAQNDMLTRMKKQAIDNDLGTLQQRDFLARAQLAENQRLKSLFK